MNINLKDADENELKYYQIALMHAMNYCQDQLIRIKTKLDKIKKENKNVKRRWTVKKDW